MTASATTDADDAILVTENTVRLMAKNGWDSRKAITVGMGEASGPVIASTAVLIAVFVPTLMMPGLTGLAESIRAQGSLSAVQLHHAGMRSPRELIGEDPVCPSLNEEFGAAIGAVVGNGIVFTLVALVISALIAFTSYWKADKIALSVSRARPAPPEEYARLHNLVEGLCIAGGLPKPGVYIIDDPAPNAFATGRNPNHAAIAVTTGLLEKLNRVELEGAHVILRVRRR